MEDFGDSHLAAEFKSLSGQADWSDAWSWVAFNRRGADDYAARLRCKEDVLLQLASLAFR